MKKTRTVTLILVMALLISIILPMTVNPAFASTTGVVTEHFSDETVGATAFSTSSVGFQLGGNLSVYNYAAYGYTGTAPDDYYADNYNDLISSPGIVGSIQV